MNHIFGKKVDPVEQAKEWKRSLAREQRSIERNIAHIKREENKATVCCSFQQDRMSYERIVGM